MRRFLLITLLICTNTIYAQGFQLEGVVDCGTWSKTRRADTAGYLEYHLMGFIDGFTLVKNTEIWGRTDGIRVSRDSPYLWMDGWCQKNPLKKVIAGTGDFAIERTDGYIRRKKQE
jgi:hypothetical protein